MWTLHRAQAGRLRVSLPGFPPADWQGSLSRMRLVLPQSPQMASHLLLARCLLPGSGVLLCPGCWKMHPQRLLPQALRVCLRSWVLFTSSRRCRQPPPPARQRVARIQPREARGGQTESQKCLRSLRAPHPSRGFRP